MKSLINTKTLIQKIEKITRERMAKADVVNLREYRDVKFQNPPTILLIEDDEVMRSAIQKIFEEEGLRVRSASDGTQLSKVLDDTPIDLILMDVGLPWINGLELARLLKEHEYLKKIPLVFVSGKTGELDVQRGFAAGADAYVKKPFSVEEIKHSVMPLIVRA